MENVVFTYQRTKEDVITQQVWQTYKRNKLIMVLTFFFPVLGIGFLINSIMEGSDPIVYLAIAYLILYPAFNYFFILMRINKLFKNPEVAFDVTTFDYSSEGVSLSSAKGDLLLEWDRVTKVYDTKEYIYIYVDRRSSIMVKKSIITEHQVEFILKLIKDQTSENCCNY